MTQHKVGPEKQFVGSKLPWLIAALGLALYALTLNSWISLKNFSAVAKSSGWTLAPDLQNPLYFLLTYPFRWLPEMWVPLAYNVFSLVCAVLTLALLARSVALLPHDRTADQRQREKTRTGLLSLPGAWIPPVLATLVFGLQLTFWEEATAGGSGLLDLLLLAYVIRSLLEYRLDQRESWLLRSAFLWALGMANDWLLFCLFPGFLTALIWIRGWSFFNGQFLFRMFLCAVAGLLLYLLLPLIHVFSDHQIASFWQALKVNLAADKNAFVHFYGGARANVLLSLALTSLLPLLIIGVRWASNFGDPSRMGGAAASWTFHLTHGALLVACLWVAFNPKFSPRGLGYPLPALYYLGALSVGYLAGYFLLVFRPLPDRMGRTSGLQHFLHTASRVTIWTLLFVIPAGLLYRNLPQIRTSNGPALKEYAASLAERLPEKAVLLCDDAQRLLLVRAWTARSGKDTNFFFLDTRLLPQPAYHAYQRSLHGAEWPALISATQTNRIEDVMLIRLAATFAEKRPVYYLNPSFGYYFEYFDAQPKGATFELKPYPTNSLSGLPLTEAEVARNEQFWAAAQPALDRLTPFIRRSGVVTNVSVIGKLMAKLHILPEGNATASLLGGYYSQVLNSWGVDLQCAGKLPEARRHFEMAMALSPDNLAARSNRTLNDELHAGTRPSLTTPKPHEQDLGRYRTMQQVLEASGPFDAPNHRFSLGVVFTRGRLFRQAGQQFERVHELIPENLPTRVWLAGLYTRHRLPDKALELLAGLRQKTAELEQAGIQRRELLQVEAVALFTARRTAEGDQLLVNTVRDYPEDPGLLATVVQVSGMFGRHTNALSALNRLLKLRPDDPSLLVNKGLVHMHLGSPQEAIPSFTRALEVQSNNFNARLYRAVAHLTSGGLDAAENDYQALQKFFPASVEVSVGLAEIALRRHDTNAAIAHYETSLKNCAPNSEPFRRVSERLQKLQAGKP